MQPVGELDQQHPHVVGDRQQELAQVFGLLGLLGDEVELLELGQALDQRADVAAEHLVDLGAGGVGVLDGVVQQRRRDGGVVELEVGQDRRDFERMGEIRIAGGALLLAMRLHGVDIGAVEQRLVGVRIVAPAPARSGRIAASSAACGLFDFALFNDLGDDAAAALDAARWAGAWFCMRGRSVEERGHDDPGAVGGTRRPRCTQGYHGIR